MDRQAGFTWIELLLVIAVIAILATMALPGMKETALRKQVKEALEVAEIAKKAVSAAWAAGGEMPKDNKAAGLPDGDLIVGNLVRAVEVDDGAVTVTFGNNASQALHGKRVTVRPAVVLGQPVVPAAWLCHAIAVPKGMEIQGRDRTDVPPEYLPLECRPPGGK